MLDKLPPWARHLALLLLAAVFTWLGERVVPLLADLQGIGALVAPLVAAVVAVLLAAITPLTRQYGVGSPPPNRTVDVGAGVKQP